MPKYLSNKNKQNRFVMILDEQKKKKDEEIFNISWETVFLYVFLFNFKIKFYFQLPFQMCVYTKAKKIDGNIKAHPKKRNCFYYTPHTVLFVVVLFI